MLQHRVTGAAERSNGAATKGGQQQPQEAQRIQQQQPHIDRPTATAATAKAKKIHRHRPFSAPPTSKKFRFRLTAHHVYAIYNPLTQTISTEIFQKIGNEKQNLQKIRML